MKTKMLFALWICFAYAVNTPAQNEEPGMVNAQAKDLKDTVIIKPDSGIMVLLIGNDLQEMVSENKMDSLKTLLIADVAKAHTEPGYPSASKVTYYFVHPSGRRRLKAESEDYSEPQIDIKKEMRALNLNLPPYEFIIYDLITGYEYHIYMRDAGELDKLSAINFKDAFAALLQNKKALKHSYRVDEGKDNGQWKILNNTGNKEDMIEFNPSFGMSLYGSRWSPVVSFDLLLTLNDKYKTPLIKTGFSYGVNTFAEWNNADITSLSAVASYNIKFLINMSDTKPRWTGIEGGIMKDYNGQSPFNNKTKFGIAAEGFGAFNFSFDVILYKKKSSIYALTLKLPF